MTTAVTRPYVLALADPSATELAVTGGKGASLARLAAAGLPVPGGFHVTTAAYRTAVTGAARDAVLAAAAEVDPDRPETHEAAAGRIAAVFAGLEPPEEVSAAIRAAYGELGSPAVAVRSSATAEDLPGMSFAGQQDTFLNVRGEDALLHAVRDCWASLWTARAIGYRARHGIAPDDVTLAVVVQELVDADAAGIMFTADPMTGSRESILINAAWGLGEAVVGGQVTPDAFAVPRAGGAVSVTVGDKTVRTVRTPDGTHEEPVPGELRTRPSLSEEQAAELAALGVSIEELYGTAMDIEWAVRAGEPYVLQARPVTGPAADGPLTEVWNDSLRGDYLWTNANLGEALPSVMTPLTWSLVKIFMANAMVTPDIGHPLYGTIGGRFYMNLSVMQSIGAAFGMTKALDAANREVFGRLPGHTEIPLIPMSRWEMIRRIVPLVGSMRRRLARNIKAMPGYLETAERRGEELRVRASAQDSAAGLARFWRDELEPYLLLSSAMLQAAGKQDGNALVYLRRDLRQLLGDTDADAITTGLGGGGDGLASLAPLVGLARLARGEIDKDTYVRRYGHRAPDEFEVSVPRPAEDPRWLDRQLAHLGEGSVDVDELLAAQAEARDAAWRRLQERYPGKAAKMEKRLARWAKVARDREETRSEVVRTFWAIRAFCVRAGEVTGLGDDVFALSIEELLSVLDGAEAPAALVARRRATYEMYRALPSYPAVIRGRFDPVRWAADPNRRSDVYDPQGSEAPSDGVVRGFPGAAGVVEGTARVIATVEEGDALRPGEILVTTVTNVGWTPLFPRAAAVVTDVGAPLSHAAIVARELGIPAVVGCGDAMMRIRTGDHLRVNGEAGTVEIL